MDTQCRSRVGCVAARQSGAARLRGNPARLCGSAARPREAARGCARPCETAAETAAQPVARPLTLVQTETLHSLTRTHGGGAWARGGAGGGARRGRARPPARPPELPPLRSPTPRAVRREGL